jgi:hypothetical protein
MQTLTINGIINSKPVVLTVARKRSSLTCFNIYREGHWMAAICKDEKGAFELLSYTTPLTQNEVNAMGRQIELNKNMYRAVASIAPNYIQNVA